MRRGGIAISVEEVGIGLAEAIEVVRAELQQATDAGRGTSIAFRPTAVQLDVQVEFARTGGADAGVRVWVVSIGGKGEVRSAMTQRISLTLEPFDRSVGGALSISDEGDR